MDAEFIKAVGFPVAACVAMGSAFGSVLFWMGRRLVKAGDRIVDRTIVHIDSIDATHEKISPALERIESKLDRASPVCRFSEKPA